MAKIQCPNLSWLARHPGTEVGTPPLVLDNHHNQPDGVYYAFAVDNPASTNLLVWRTAV